MAGLRRPLALRPSQRYRMQGNRESQLRVWQWAPAWPREFAQWKEGLSLGLLANRFDVVPVWSDIVERTPWLCS